SVDGQENVLNRIFDVAPVTDAAGSERPQIRRDRLEQAPVRIPVARLRVGHQDRPVERAVGTRLRRFGRMIRLSRILSIPYDTQRWARAVRSGGHVRILHAGRTLS